MCNFFGRGKLFPEYMLCKARLVTLTVALVTDFGQHWESVDIMWMGCPTPANNLLNTKSTNKLDDEHEYISFFLMFVTYAHNPNRNLESQPRSSGSSRSSRSSRSLTGTLHFSEHLHAVDPDPDHRTIPRNRDHDITKLETIVLLPV